MGLTDPEDLIPGIIIVIALIGFIGGLITYIPAINDVPVLGMISSLTHSGFTLIGGFLTTYIPLEASIIGLLIELLIIIISIIIIVKVGY